jgi:hypothetical protein
MTLRPKRAKAPAPPVEGAGGSLPGAVNSRSGTQATVRRLVAGAIVLGPIVLAGLAGTDFARRAEHLSPPPLTRVSAAVAPTGQPSLPSVKTPPPSPLLSELIPSPAPSDSERLTSEPRASALPTEARHHTVRLGAALPISFEANAGQTDPRVQFLAHAPGYTLFLADQEAVLSLPLGPPAPLVAQAGRPVPPVPGRRSEARRAAKSGRVVRLRFLGARTPAAVSGRDPLPGTSNYLIGSDPKQWHTDVPNYSAVEYRGIYSGVDAVFHGDDRRLEFDFEIAPGADPHTIELEVDGARQVRLDRAGNLLLRMDAERSLVMAVPHVYQQSPQGRRPIAGRYVLGARNRIAFAVDPYDRTQPLVIDPTIEYATYLGGSSENYAEGVAVDSSGDTYVAGYTSSTNFPVVNGYQTTCEDCSVEGEAFITKLNPAGSALVYSTYLSGADITAIAVDSSGSAYVTGYASTPPSGTPGLPAVNAYQAANDGKISNAFVSKLSADGSSLVYSTFLGGSYFDEGFGIAVDSSGSAYVTGLTNSFNFPTVNPIQSSCNDCAGSSGDEFDGDAFITKFSPDGSSLVYSTYLGGSAQDWGTAIAVDSTGSAYVTGLTQSTNFPTANAFQAANASTALATTGENAFVTKLNPEGSALVYSTYLGGSAEDYGNGIAVDSAGSAYVTGFAQSHNFPTLNPYQSLMLGANNAFVTKFNADGSALVYSTYLGGDSASQGNSIAIDAFGNAYVTGSTTSNNFPLVEATQTSCQGCSSYSSAFVAQFNATGSALLFSTYLGGSNQTVGYGIAVDPSGDAHVAGLTSSANFPTVAPYQATNRGASATAFVAMYSFSAETALTLAPATLPSGTIDTAYSPVTITAAGATGTVTFAITSGSLPAGMTLTTAGVLSGTPTQPGTFSLTVTAADSSGDSGSQSYSLEIACQTITVSPDTLNPGTSGASYPAVTFTETGGIGTTTFSETGALPTGITFVAPVLSGTPTQTGTFPFEVTATDANNCTGSVSDSLTINAATSAPVPVNDMETINVSDTETFPDVPDAEKINVTDAETVRAFNSITIAPTPTSFNAGNGTGYATYAYTPVQFTATGGIGTLTLSETGALPTGLTFVNGTLGGTPASSSVGAYTFSVTATDADGDSATLQSYSITIQPASAYVPKVNDMETIDVSDTETFADVPDGETIGVADTETLRAFNTIAIAPSAASFNASDGAGIAGASYGPVAFVATGGTGALSLTESGALPLGLTFTGGVLSGMLSATSAGSYTFSVTATDADQDQTTQQGYTLTVGSPPPPSLRISANPDSLTIDQGQTGTTTLTFAPAGGFAATLSLSCSGLPAYSLCSFAENGTSVNSVVLNGNNQPVTVQLELETNVNPEQAMSGTIPRQSGPILPAFAFWWSGSLLGLAAFKRRLKMSRKNQSGSGLFLLLLLTFVAAVGLASCGGKNSSNDVTPIGTSTMTISATPGSGAAQTLNISVTVTP